MLIEFSVENYKSFRDRTTFSMIAGNLTSEDTALDRDNVVPVTADLRLLKTTAIYGANASGKSNLGAALRFMKNFVLNSSNSTQASEAVPVEPFLLSTETRDRPSQFEVVFWMDGRQFRYGFEADSKRVISEWLFHVPTTKEATLFVREGQEITVKAAFKEGKGLEGRVRENALFLSVVAQFNGTSALNIQKWFQDFSVTTGLEDDEFRDHTLRDMRDPALRPKIDTFLKRFDLGFRELVNVEISGGVDDAYPPLRLMLALHDVEGDNALRGLEVDGHESQGTRKLIALSGPLLSILAHGQPLFIDEFDARLHPLITRRIVEMFHSPETNPHGAQLILVTHDTNLLDRTLLRRDQIWFAEKDRQGGTRLTSLAEFGGVRNDAAFEKQYLEGRYGGIPFLGELTRLPPLVSEPTPEPAHG